MTITIETPTLENDTEMTNVVAKAWLATYPDEESGISIEDVEKYVGTWSSSEVQERRQENLKKFFNDKDVLYRVAIIDKKIVGVMRAKEHEEYVHLYSMYVLPEFQGKGVGSELMKTFLKWANHDKEIRLHVATYNQKAIGFYASWGFMKVGKMFEEQRFTFASGNTIPQIKMVLKE